MNEEMLETTGIDEDDAPILPSGWKDGDDIFDGDNWTGEEDPSGQAENPTETQDPTETGTDDVDALTTGDDTTAAEDDSAAAETDHAQPGQVEEPAKATRILKLKVNHGKNDQEVDVNAMSDDELVAELQKARAFDAMKETQNKEKYRQVYHDQIDSGMTEAAARLIAQNECGGKTYPLDDAPKEEPPAETTVTPAEPAPRERDFQSEVRQLRALYPDFKEMPDEVAVAVAGGASLLTAYVAYRERQTSQAAASLKKENEVLKQNAASAAKAPVRGVTGGGVTDTKPKSDFLAGLMSDDW